MAQGKFKYRYYSKYEDPDDRVGEINSYLELTYHEATQLLNALIKYFKEEEKQIHVH